MTKSLKFIDVMEPLRYHQGIVAPLNRANVDTDQIIPKQFLKKIEKTGFGQHLFHDWRFLDSEGKIENPDFILNQPKYKKATILLVRENFGCGSSREHAPWALLDYGFKVIIAPSFADIFYNNCFKNGILLIVLDNNLIQELFDYALTKNDPILKIDLRNKTVEIPDKKKFYFDIDPFRQECLINGWDDIGLTLRYEEKIQKFEEEYGKKFEFLFSSLK